MTILFEDRVHLEAAMPFCKLQFNINCKFAIFVVSTQGCWVYCCFIYLFDMHYGIIARNKKLSHS